MRNRIVNLIFIAMAFSSIQSLGQDNTQRMQYANKVKQYSFMKYAGATLTVTGIVCIIVGVAKESNPPEYTGYGKPPSTLTNEVMGLMVGGIACTGTGIPLWTIGGYNQKKYQQKLTNLSSVLLVDHSSGDLRFPAAFSKNSRIVFKCCY